MKSIKILAIMLFSSVLWAGCQPEENLTLGEPRQVLKELSGSYTLLKVTQTDNDAVKKGFPYKTLDITKFYTGLKASFNTGGSGEPTTFTFTPGSGGNTIISLAAGSWSVDNKETPKELSFTSGGLTEKIELGNYTALDSRKLLLKVVRKLNGTPLVTYEYEFTKN